MPLSLVTTMDTSDTTLAGVEAGGGGEGSYLLKSAVIKTLTADSSALVF